MFVITSFGLVFLLGGILASDSTDGLVQTNPSVLIVWSHDGDDKCMVLNGAGALSSFGCESSLPYFCRKVSARKCGTGYEYHASVGSCYKFHTIALDFRAAMATCHNEGGHLALINSDKESKVLKEIFGKYPAEMITGCEDPDYALVGFRKYDGDLFATIFGETVAQAGFNKWSDGGPNNKDGNENCGSIFRNGLLNDLKCFEPYPFICEITPYPQ